MTVSGQFSCPPAGSFVAVSGQFLVSADNRITTNAHATVLDCDDSMRKHFTHLE